jgi:hypothetical protein
MKLMSPAELSPLFPGSGYLGGNQVEATFCLLRVSKIEGILSMTRIFWIRLVPKSITGWVFWAIVYGLVVALITCLGNHGHLFFPAFIAGIVPSVIPVVRCLEQGCAQYNWAVSYCLRVVNTTRQHPQILNEDSLRLFLRQSKAKNLIEFRSAYPSIQTTDILLETQK